MKRFWDGAWLGFLVLVAAVGVFVAGFAAGDSSGQRSMRSDLERQGGGRYVELSLDGHQYKGWLR